MSENNGMKWYGWGSPGKEFDLSRRQQFWPYLTSKLNLNGDEQSLPVDLGEIQLPPADPERVASRFVAIVGGNWVRTDQLARITHACGKSYLDLLRVRRGQIDHAPDIVVYPETEAQVLALLQAAADHKVAVIPFGGGTSVVGGVEAMRAQHHVATLSMDLGRLNRIINIDEISLVATMEAGIRGPALEQQLQSFGYTLGHYPQSFEFSTLGGWVATRSAGQQSTKYGKIEDMVASVTLASPLDLICTLDAPASAAGPSLKEMIVGSEGIFGVITQAKMRIHKLPQAKLYRGILFKDFYFGSQAIRTMIQSGLKPSTVRLSDEAETEAIMKMNPESESMLESAVSKAYKLYLKKRGYMGLASLMILGFEDHEATATKELKAAIEICNQYDGVDLGASAGDKWYRDRFELPYLRDVLLDRALMIDTLETATTWSNLLEVYNRVKEALIDSIKAFNFKSTPLVLCHISHSYPDGASLYFTFLSNQVKGVEIEQWYAAKEAASEAIVSAGATISHHHGVGRDHARWARREIGKLGSIALASVKHAFDPMGILNPGKLLR